MTSQAAIAMAGLTKHYPGVQALTDLTLEVPTGTIYGFLGPNGAGKTTALKLLAGLVRPTRGTAHVAGVPVTAGPAYRRQVGYLSQEPRFYGWMTGRETIEYVGSLYPVDARPNAARVREVLDLVELTEAADRPAGTYSGGMRQRLGIAQALVARPPVLLLDEPVSSLDPIGRREVLELMQQVKGEATIFYSTHILDDVQRVSDHVAILDRGRLVRAQPTADLLSSSTRDRMQVVLGFATDDTAVALAAIPGVVSVEPTDRDADSRSYILRIDPDAAATVQRAVTRLAAESDLTVIDNSHVREDLEDVFIRLVDTKEHAA
ncbi:MAG TPA: ABC transporter ATP-binding protein [Candidatus Limnocylindria bacterium]|nr:ABC transporter ATP-binding protein [Candidatus Limnocylindria bacterium]